MIIMCAPTVRARSSASLRLARASRSSSREHAALEQPRRTLISMLNCPSSVWNAGSAIASSAAALISAGSPASSVRLSSISSPNDRFSGWNRASDSIRANTSRFARTFLR